MSVQPPVTDLARQEKMILALRNGGMGASLTKPVRLIETHISWVLLVGRFAYKIKKALDLGFLDFSTLAQRKFYCEEELRLNRRTAPQIYLEVIPIGGTSDKPIPGDLPAIDYAVRMHRFSADEEMDNLIQEGNLLASHVDSLAMELARFHMSLPPRPTGSSYGSSQSVQETVLQSFSGWPPSVLDTVGEFVLSALRHEMEDEFASCTHLIEQRSDQGFVRECHGDLHLGNIVVMNGVATPFDGIEFSPSMRWIDVMSDVAFPYMDFLHYGRRDLAFRFVNAWLTMSGDYDGVSLLRYYAAYRAVVRAKINAIRAVQPGLPSHKKTASLALFRRYLSKASRCLARETPALIITHGLPGSGKTAFSQIALERFGAIRIRSDVERKRLFGLAPLESSRSGIGDRLYAKGATEKTYERLHDLAAQLLAAGYRVIVDAAFLQREEREQFRLLAAQRSARFVIVSIQTGDDVLRQRVTLRMQGGGDASEADLEVLSALQASWQALEDGEEENVIRFINDGASGFPDDAAGWLVLQDRIS